MVEQENRQHRRQREAGHQEEAVDERAAHLQDPAGDGRGQEAGDREAEIHDAEGRGGALRGDVDVHRIVGGIGAHRGGDRHRDAGDGDAEPVGQRHRDDGQGGDELAAGDDVGARDAQAARRRQKVVRQAAEQPQGDCGGRPGQHGEQADGPEVEAVLVLQVGRQPAHEEEQEIAEDEEGPVVGDQRPVGQQRPERPRGRPGLHRTVLGPWGLRGGRAIRGADVGQLRRIHESGLGRVVAEQEEPQRHPGQRDEEQDREGRPPVQPAEQLRDDRAAGRERQGNRDQGIGQRRRPFVRRQPVADGAGQRGEVGTFGHAEQHARRIQHREAARAGGRADRQAPQHRRHGHDQPGAVAIDGEAADQGRHRIAQPERAQDDADLRRRQAEIPLHQRDGVRDGGAVDIVHDRDREQEEDDEPSISRARHCSPTRPRP